MRSITRYVEPGDQKGAFLGLNCCKFLASSGGDTRPTKAELPRTRRRSPFSNISWHIPNLRSALNWVRT